MIIKCEICKFSKRCTDKKNMLICESFVILAVERKKREKSIYFHQQLTSYKAKQMLKGEMG